MNGTFMLLVIGAIAGFIAYIIMGKKSENKIKMKKDEHDTLENGTVKRKTSREVNKKDIMDFMEFDKIIDDMIVQENEKKYTMVLQCKGINYDLMSDVEQLAVEEGFIVFLNTLKFPVQLFVQARAVDLKKSMDIYKASVNDITEKFNVADENYRNILNDISAEASSVKMAKEERDRFSNILEYAQDITRYVERISLNKNILQRKFYIVFSYYKSEVSSVSEFSEDEVYEICKRELQTRAQTIMSALTSCSVTSQILNSNELAELLFISYNRDDERLLDIETALESGFYRLYSTSKDVYEKKEELLQKEVEQEASRRVQEAILQTLKNVNVRTEDEIEEEFEEQADRQALEIIRDADIDDESKQNLSNIISKNHVINAEKRRIERENRIAQEQLKDEENSEDADNYDEGFSDDNINEDTDENVSIMDSSEDDIIV